MRRAAKVDFNHKAIIMAFRGMGLSAVSTAMIGNGFPDIIIAKDKRNSALVEVKDGNKPPSAQKLTPDQVEFHKTWRGRIFICKSIVEVPAIVQAMK